MVPAPFIVVLDANVLYPFSLRDTLLRCAAAGFYQARWSSQILDEVTRNLVTNEIMPEDKAARLRAIMEREFPEALIADYEPLIAGMKNHEKDRHVAAAAVKAGAQVIVTLNLKDFGGLPASIEAKSPDDFLCDLLDLDPEGFVELVREQADDLINPKVGFDQLLDRLARVVPGLVATVQEHVAAHDRQSEDGK